MVKSLPAMRETWVRSLGWEYPLVQKMATQPSILPWEIPWTEEPGRLQSMGSQSDTTQQLHFHFSIIIHRFPSIKLFFYPEYSFNSFILLGFYLFFSTKTTSILFPFCALLIKFGDRVVVLGIYSEGGRLNHILQSSVQTWEN